MYFNGKVACMNLLERTWSQIGHAASVLSILVASSLPYVSSHQKKMDKIGLV